MKKIIVGLIVGIYLVSFLVGAFDVGISLAASDFEMTNSVIGRLLVLLLAVITLPVALDILESYFEEG